MASPTIQRSPTSSSPLQRLSTFKERTTTTTTTTTLTAAASTPPSSAITTTPLNSLASDPIFSAFLSHDFDSARFSSLALSPGSAAARAEKLQDGIRLLEKQLRSEVLSRHHHLLSQLFSVREADSALFPLRSAVSNLHSSVRHVRSEIADPHRQIRAKTLQLSGLHHTAELLQATIRVLRLSKKLRDVMDPFDHSERLDLAKAAQLHCEILTLCNENDQLTGIAVVDEELDWVFEAGQKLRSEGMRVLERGLEGLNQAEVGAGLQVFYNLG